jgi:hypothetical protein
MCACDCTADAAVCAFGLSVGRALHIFWGLLEAAAHSSRPLVIANIDSSTDRHDAAACLKALEKRVAELVFPSSQATCGWALDKKISRVNFYSYLFSAFPLLQGIASKLTSNSIFCICEITVILFNQFKFYQNC